MVGREVFDAEPFAYGVALRFVEIAGNTSLRLSLPLQLLSLGHVRAMHHIAASDNADPNWLFCHLNISPLISPI